MDKKRIAPGVVDLTFFYTLANRKGHKVQHEITQRDLCRNYMAACSRKSASSILVGLLLFLT